MARALPVVVLLAGLVLAATACGGTAPAPDSAPPGYGAPAAGSSLPYLVATRSEAGGAPAEQAGPYPVAADGKALMNDRCTKCHNTDRIQAAKKSQPDWAATVTRMKGKGAQLNDSETQALLAYLAATYK